MKRLGEKQNMVFPDFKLSFRRANHSQANCVSTAMGLLYVMFKYVIESILKDESYYSWRT